MSEASAASQLASVMRSATSHQARSVREAVQPERMADSLKLSATGGGNAKSTSPFDATGQISPSAKSDDKGASSNSILNLLA
ncbi:MULTISPECIES: hypothetical protein [Saccharibacter]|uniref:Uncharacterized protein n=1 Tax=Saccharibacter floricola DSM 15669 TaxID=1123227 RepID=A0ABQ0NXH2_9PROT|nr:MULTISPECIES: hypothetical protein [Saccharibacter]MXV36032.1 hypothetical protein [Saccharibacter sp. EH611]MXV56891.1 hypothetical protein [Saccharibacter sp. EH70]MXV66749.1 hypothetical protein [Saccharibacter sp. EH60]GBQ05815.1 hypothetical protein AA15669_0647 [Saccharibacter floricola DSM 15669]